MTRVVQDSNYQLPNNKQICYDPPHNYLLQQLQEYEWLFLFVHCLIPEMPDKTCELVC